MDKGQARIPCLDGLRAVSIFFVLFGHLAGTRGFPIEARYTVLPFMASLGVRVFFVISGYLITRLLLIEQEDRGSIALSRFYFRRIFRILVPYYVFLVVMIGAQQLGWVPLADGDLAYALTYASNYHHGQWTLGHTWSLAVEEQFYLLWPALLVVIGVQRAFKGAVVFLFTAPLIRLFIWYRHPELHQFIGHTFGTVADTIAAGCILAVVSDSLWMKDAYRKFLASKWFAAVAVAVLATVVVEDRPRLAFTIGAFIVNVGVALCVDRCIRLPGSLASRALALPAMVAIGRASYSIYIWQQPFLDRTSSGIAAFFPLNIVLLGIVATAGYFWIEKPAIAVRPLVEARIRELFAMPGRTAAAWVRRGQGDHGTWNTRSVGPEKRR
jgi:peptidoglycan/LPS O-acetylase OafA/YrhL